MVKSIFESPDGGHTVYVREDGKSERTLYSIDQVALDAYTQTEWNKIWRERNRNPALKKAIDQVIILYKLGSDNE